MGCQPQPLRVKPDRPAPTPRVNYTRSTAHSSPKPIRWEHVVRPNRNLRRVQRAAKYLHAMAALQTPLKHLAIATADNASECAPTSCPGTLSPHPEPTQGA